MEIPQERKLVTEIPGPRSRELLERRRSAVPNGLGSSTPVFAEAASGAVIRDVDGNQLIDLGAGIAVLNVGSSAAPVVEAISAQLQRFTHTCMQVTQYEPGTSFTWVSARGGVRTEAYHRLVRGPEGLSVELGLAQTGALAWLIAALYGGLTRRYVGMEARGLKQACEPAT